MRKILIFCAFMALVATPAGATIYNVVDNQAVHGAPGPLNLVQTIALTMYSQDNNHRVYYAAFSLTNNSATMTYTDVKVVDPFDWLYMPSLSPIYQACGWVNAQNQFIDPEYNGNDGLLNGLFVKIYDGTDDPPESAMLISNTNIPLTSPLGAGYETASVLATDQVPSWTVAASLAPSQSVSFKVYWDVERRGTAPTVNGKYADLYVVATPEPATIALLGLGALGLLRRRRA